jgi:hypothetical protein
VVEACPKCGTARVETRTSCAKCGLAHEKMAAFEQARDAVPEALTTAWDGAVASWDDSAKHDELLRLVTQNDAYAWAAARYRDRMRERADDAIAKAQLDRVRRAAEATLAATAAARPSRVPEPYRRTVFLLGILIIVIIAGLVYRIARGRTSEPVPDRAPIPPHVKKG